MSERLEVFYRQHIDDLSWQSKAGLLHMLAKEFGAEVVHRAKRERRNRQASRPWQREQLGFPAMQFRLLEFLHDRGPVENRAIIRHLWGGELPSAAPPGRSVEEWAKLAGVPCEPTRTAGPPVDRALRARRRLKSDMNDRLSRNGHDWRIRRPRNNDLQLTHLE